MGIIGCAVMLGVLALPSASPQIEVGGGVSLPLSQDSQVYTSRYEPPFPFVTHEASATQQLTLDPTLRPGVWGSISWFPQRRVGLEVRGAFARVPLQGANEPYEISLTYETRQPPDSVLRSYHLDRSTPWPATEGHIDQLTVSGSIVGLIGNPDRLSLRLSGGLALTSTSGQIEPLGYTTFQLGGHAVVFSNDYTLRMQVERTWTAAFEGGAEVARAVGNHVTLIAGVRIRLGPEVVANLTVADVSGDTAIQSLTPADAEAVLTAPPLNWDLSGPTFVAGLGVRF